MCDGKYEKLYSETGEINVQIDEPSSLNYGQYQDISDSDTVSLLSVGSVFMIKDDPTDRRPTAQRHPYILIQDTFLDKYGTVEMFTISTTPADIDMIPIICRGLLAYINPHKIQNVKKEHIMNSDVSKFYGIISDITILNLVCDMHDMHTRPRLQTKKSDIIADYLNYINNFKQCLKVVNPMVKNKLKFKTSYDVNFNLFDDSCNKKSSNIIKKKADTVAEKQNIKIDLTDPNILDQIINIENSKEGGTLPRFISKMSVDEIKLLIAIIKIKGYKCAQEIYHTTRSTLANKKSQLNELYDIEFI